MAAEKITKGTRAQGRDAMREAKLRARRLRRRLGKRICRGDEGAEGVAVLKGWAD